MEILITNKWNNYLDSFNIEDKDIYFTEEYVKLYENSENSAECFVCRNGDKTYLLPYLKRKVKLMEGDYYDFETPYGYGGPISNTRDENFLKYSSRSFYELAGKNNFIAGFLRFHPVLANHKFVNNEFGAMFDRKTVAVDLTLNKDDIWTNQVHRKHRTSIRKAENLGLRFEADCELKHYDKFIRMYSKLMNSLQSDEFYYFDDKYYEALKDSIGKDCFLGLVYIEDKIIACIIYFLYGVYGHAHLGGGLNEYYEYCPNNFMFYNAALYLKDRGAKLFHFGGGTTSSPEDPLYKFKKRFSKLEYDYYVGKMLINEKMYGEACSLWDKETNEQNNKYKKFFLKYRY